MVNNAKRSHGAFFQFQPQCLWSAAAFPEAPPKAQSERRGQTLRRFQRIPPNRCSDVGLALLCSFLATGIQFGLIRGSQFGQQIQTPIRAIRLKLWFGCRSPTLDPGGTFKILWFGKLAIREKRSYNFDSGILANKCFSPEPMRAAGQKFWIGSIELTPKT